MSLKQRWELTPWGQGLPLLVWGGSSPNAGTNPCIWQQSPFKPLPLYLAGIAVSPSLGAGSLPSKGLPLPWACLLSLH